MLKKRGLWSAVLGVGVTFTMLLSACGPTSSTTGGTIKNGGSIVDGISQEPSSLMIGQSTQSFAQLVQRSIWEPMDIADFEKDDEAQNEADAGQRHEAR